MFFPLHVHCGGQINYVALAASKASSFYDRTIDSIVVIRCIFVYTFIILDG